ncbi:hypothetical protein [Nocardioides sp. R-C-SC26]|uniref:hypothetical protein n=1 Tax=Nocardioides sp. R-C-SC26 TaxID=2870414 RepID=UPI001E48EF2C|nr:hypothetical protein [Nocardioides sp. R-C-SC26]
MSSATQQAQIARIARLLHLRAEEIEGLDDVASADLRVLHDQIATSLFAGGQRRFAGVAQLSGAIPVPAAAKLAEKFLPPMLAARVSELLEPAKAAELVRRIGLDYLVEVAIALDPARATPVVRSIPAERVGEVARELIARQEYGVLAEFVRIVDDRALAAAVVHADDDDRDGIAPFLDVEDLARLDALR